MVDYRDIVGLGLLGPTRIGLRALDERPRACSVHFEYRRRSREVELLREGERHRGCATPDDPSGSREREEQKHGGNETETTEHGGSVCVGNSNDRVVASDGSPNGKKIREEGREGSRAHLSRAGG